MSAQAEAEGLTLLRAKSKTGYFGVQLNKPGQPKPYLARVWRGGKKVRLGSFATAEEAALCVARSPEGQAAAQKAAAAPVPLTSEEARQQAQAEELTLLATRSRLEGEARVVRKRRKAAAGSRSRSRDRDRCDELDRGRRARSGTDDGSDGRGGALRPWVWRQSETRYESQAFQHQSRSEAMESNDGDDCGRQPTAPAAPAAGMAFDKWLSRHGGRHVSPPRPSDMDAGGGLSFTNGPAAPLLAPPPLAAHPNATEEQLHEMITVREDVSRALMLELRASEDARLAAEAAWSRAEAELVRWQRGELRLVPEVTDAETGQVSSTVVTETEAQRRGLKRPCETALAHIIETSQKTVKIKQEVVEQRAEAADAKGRLEDQLACVVCMEQPRSVVLRPCNHYVCCSECARRQTHCPSAGCSVLVASRLRGICMAPHQQAFEMGTGPPTAL